jgi:hypothetical protein
VRSKTPDAGGTVQQERDVVPLLFGESGGAAVSPFVPIVEPDHPWKLHDAGDQVKDISWAIVGSDEQGDIEVAPAHQVGDIAPRHLRGSDVGEDSRSVQLVKELRRLGSQRRLPGCKLLVATRQ